MGKPFFALVVSGIIIVIGMLTYPTVHSIWAGIDTTGELDLTKAGMIVLSYLFIFWMAYAVYKTVKK